MQAVSLRELREQAQQHADMEESDFLSTAEWNGLVNDAVADLYDLLVQAAPPEYDAAQVTFPYVAGQRLYALPGDFRSATKVLRVVGRREEEIQPLRPDERNLVESPRDSGTILLEYTPTPPILAADTDTVDCVSGWRTFICASVAAVALLKEESDASTWLGLAERERTRIVDAGSNRDRGAPKFIGANERSRLRNRHWTDLATGTGALRYRIRGGNLELFSL